MTIPIFLWPFNRLISYLFTKIDIITSQFNIKINVLGVHFDQNFILHKNMQKNLRKKYFSNELY